MKKQILVVGLVLMSAIAFGQKKELKKAEKALAEKDIIEAMAMIKQAETSIDGADDKLKAQFYAVKGEIYLADATAKDFGKMKSAADAFTKASEFDATGKYKEKAANGMQNLRVKLVNSAVNDQKAKRYAQASEKLYISYTIKKDTSDLYYAAGNAVNAKEYDTALKYYEELLDIKYTGIKKEFVAMRLSDGETIAFPSEEDRNVEMLTGKYTNPSERLAPSARGDILRNVTLLYASKGENEKALSIMKAAREENPNDATLIRSEADMAYSMGDMEKYNSLMSEIVASDPNNPELYYNLGVGSAKLGENEKAMGYYKKALELKPDYAAAQINIAALMLQKESMLVEEMNNLGTSSADNKRYDELKAERKSLYERVIPYLESALEQRGDNVELVRTLMNIYSQLGNDAKFKAMKDKLATMEEGN